MVGINYSTLCSRVQERNQKQGKNSALTGVAATPQVQCCAGDGMGTEFRGDGARLRIWDERDAELVAVVLRAMGRGIFLFYFC